MASVPSDRARTLVDQALQRPCDSRLEFLRSVCGSDEQLLLETSQLLSLYSGTQPPDLGDAPTTAVPDARDRRPVGWIQPGGEFGGTDRFQLKRRLGSGGFGVVYEAFDHDRQTVLALKLLQRVTSDALYRFKREFRLLADVHHPNLVQLHELFSWEGHWFFTMELVIGRDFLGHVEGAELMSTAAARRLHAAGLDRLVAALRQLVDGLSALHRAGHIHRDVKPTNVLVTDDGRVVLLDFGLLLDMQDEAGLQTMTIAGTPQYMSPEQAAGLPITPASDWYSVGVMLFQALTGDVPFHGSYLDVLRDKQLRDPPSPSAVAEGVPPFLDALCRDLLTRDVPQRPGGQEILNRLPPFRPGVTATASSRPASSSRPFVGRESARKTLVDAYRQTVDGVPVVVAVAGPSGIGKSALVQAVLAGIREEFPTTLVLSGRCYQRESVPYKALDSIVDALARHLRRLPAVEAQALLPRDLGSMAQIFPVMADLADHVRHRVAIPADAHEMRRRAWGGLRETLARVGDRQPIVAFVDDLQWGDSDSAALLADVLRQPDPPVLLFIGSHRDVEVETSPFLRRFYTDVLSARGRSRIVQLQPLTAPEAEQLAARLLPPALATEDMASLIAAESGGNPFFVDELVRFAEISGVARERADHADSSERETTLSHMIAIRQARLPELARQLLQVVAVNARPLPEHVLKAAVQAPDIDPALSLLKAEHFVRARDAGSGEELEAYHDRIREVVTAALAPDVLRDYHRRLATAWELDARVDAELVAEHWLEAGDRQRASWFTKAAAEHADRTLAFDRAARLYQRVLDLIDPGDPGRATLMMNLGRALANAGRGVQAAAVYLDTPATNVADRLDLKGRAAQQYLFAGHIVDGLAVIREVLDEIGMALPSSRWGTLAALLLGRATLRMRGLGFRETAAQEISTLELTKVDACWSVAAGLSIIDTMRGAVFQARHLFLALRLGELHRIHRALCLEVGFVAATGSRGIGRAQRVRELIAPLTQKLGTPYANAMHALMEGAIAHLLGNWKAGAGALASAEELFATNCTGVTWELDSTRFFRMWAHYQLGELQIVKSRFPVLLKDAEERGDLYASATINGLFAHIVYLAGGDPVAASTHTRQGISMWTQPGFHMPNLWGLWSETDIAIYERRGLDAWGFVSRAWGQLRRSLLLEVQMIRINMLDLKGRAALAAARGSAAGADREGLLREVNRCAKAMARQGVRWAEALALVLRGGVANARGHQAEAAVLFAEAYDALVAVDMMLVAMVARRRHGQLAAGTGGASEVEEADAWMRSQGIENPAAIAQMFAPH